MTQERVRAIRGATTVIDDSAESIFPRVQELLLAIMSRNEVTHGDIISVFFTATGDISSVFPATAAREIGFGDIPLICSTEIPVIGSTRLCIRVMCHVYSSREKQQIRHVYLHEAQGLRDDLPA
ncbi:MAG: chorismate mutase [Actinomycetota bacterium]|jgi:chorismate mutase